MNESTILLRKSYTDYEASVKLFLDYKDKNDIDAMAIILHLMQQAIKKCLESYLITCNIAFNRKSSTTCLLKELAYNLDIIPSIYRYSTEIDLWETYARYNVYELEDINLYYTIAMDYCSLYNFVASKVSSNN